MCVCVFSAFLEFRANSQTLRFIPVPLKSVGVVLLIPTEGRLNCPERSSGSAPLLFSQYRQRDDVGESRVGGLEAPTETLILVLGQKCLGSRYLMRNPYMMPGT